MAIDLTMACACDFRFAKYSALSERQNGGLKAKWRKNVRKDSLGVSGDDS